MNKVTLILRLGVKTAVLLEANDAVMCEVPTREEARLLARERRGIFRRTIAGFCEDHILGLFCWHCHLLVSLSAQSL